MGDQPVRTIVEPLEQFHNVVHVRLDELLQRLRNEPLAP